MKQLCSLQYDVDTVGVILTFVCSRWLFSLLSTLVVPLSRIAEQVVYRPIKCLTLVSYHEESCQFVEVQATIDPFTDVIRVCNSHFMFPQNSLINVIM